MKKTLVMLAAAALTIGAASAQTTMPADAGTTARPGQYGRGNRAGQANLTPEQRADRQAQRLTKELSLSADQTEKIKQMELARGQEMQALRGQASTGDDRATMRQTMQTMRTKYDTQLKDILTPDQYTKYGQMQDNRMDYRPGRRAKDRMKS